MKKFRVRKYYVSYLEGIVKAENKEEAEIKFDATPSLFLTKKYLGNINCYDIDKYNDEIEEVNSLSI